MASMNVVGCGGGSDKCYSKIDVDLSQLKKSYRTFDGNFCLLIPFYSPSHRNCAANTFFPRSSS